jgi:hypothetical protein
MFPIINNLKANYKKMKLLVGTSKGLIVCKRFPDENWSPDEVFFEGFPVSATYADQLTQTWWVAIAHRHWGIKLYASVDEGKNWIPKSTPAYPKEAFLKSGKPAVLKKIWCIASSADSLLIGTEPGGLFISHDQGHSFDLLNSLWNHPTRNEYWFGAGRDQPFIHSIVIDPTNPKHFYIAVSCAGVYETLDGGKSWELRNKGLKAAYLPNPDAELGHDPHLLLMCKNYPQVLWQQNHCGIFRSVDQGKNWEDVSGKDGFPNYGFAIAIDDENPLKAWVIPAQSDDMRIAVNRALTVCFTDDGELHWQNLNQGLPQEYCFDIVFRHAFVRHENALVFGTSTGNLFVSENQGHEWKAVSHFLPRIENVCFAY